MSLFDIIILGGVGLGAAYFLNLGNFKEFIDDFFVIKDPCIGESCQQMLVSCPGYSWKMPYVCCNNRPGRIENPNGHPCSHRECWKYYGPSPPSQYDPQSGLSFHCD